MGSRSLVSSLRVKSAMQMRLLHNRTESWLQTALPIRSYPCSICHV
jgi:hypothetical protein